MFTPVKIRHEVLKTYRGMMWPQENKIYTNIIGGDFVSIDCMGESLAFFTDSHGNKKVMDAWTFLLEFVQVL